jgi:antitoxin Phd
MDVWQLQDAKNKFSSLVDKVVREGAPQMVTRHGKPAVVVIPVEDYTPNTKKKKNDFVSFLMKMPSVETDGEDLFGRLDSPARDTGL